MPASSEQQVVGRGDAPVLDNWLRDAELVSLVLGAWLALSSFIWPQSEVSRNNTLIVGLVMAAVAAATGVAPRIRRFNMVLSAWLLVSALAIFALPPVTLWNNAGVAVAVFTLSLVHKRHAGRARRYAQA